MFLGGGSDPPANYVIKSLPHREPLCVWGLGVGGGGGGTSLSQYHTGNRMITVQYVKYTQGNNLLPKGTFDVEVINMKFHYPNLDS